MSDVYNERIDKIISAMGLMSRKDCSRAARNGRITVNGTVTKFADIKITNNDVLCLDGEQIIYSKHMYVLLNKPEGYVCAAEDGRYPTVFELLPKNYLNLGLFTVGRLDMNTTGVLIITNDGELSHKLLSPKNKVIKTYRAITKFPVSEEDIRVAAQGIQLDDGETARPAEITAVDDHTYDIKVFEGKFHLIKRIFLALHNQVRELERIDFAGIDCQDLEKGEWRFLEEQEINVLKEAVTR